VNDKRTAVFSPWRAFTRWAHVWLGVALLIPLSLVAFSGAGLSFAQEADRVLTPGLWTISPPSGAEPLSAPRLMEILETRLPGMRLERLDLPERRQDTVMARLTDSRGQGRQVFVDPFRGEILGDRAASADPRNWLGDIHRSLVVGQAGRVVVIAASVGVIVLFILGWLGLRRRQGGDGAGRSHRWLVWAGVSLWSICAVSGVFAFALGHSLNDNTPPRGAAIGSADTLADACPGGAVDTVWWRDQGRVVVRCRDPGSLGPFGVRYDAGHGASSGAGLAEWLAAVHTGTVFGVGGRVLWFWGTLLLPLAMWLGLIAFWHRRQVRRRGGVGRLATGGDRE